MGVEVYCVVVEEAECDAHEEHIVSVELEKPMLWSATGRVIFTERKRISVREARTLLTNGSVLYVPYGGRRLPFQERTLSCDYETIRPVGKLVDLKMLARCEAQEQNNMD